MKAIVFPMHRLVSAVAKTLLILVSFAATFSVSQSLTAGEDSKFSLNSIKGCYIEALSGTVLPDPASPGFPIASLIRFCADGNGKAQVTTTQNIAGSCIVEQTGTAEYTIDQSGTGTVAATLKNGEVSDRCALLTPPIERDQTAEFKLQFGIQKPKGCLQTIGTSLSLQGFPIGYVAQGEACPQR